MSTITRTKGLLAGGALAIINIAVGAALLIALSEHLRSRHLDGTKAAGMGQGPNPASGLGAGSDAVDEAIETWAAWEQAHPGHASWQEIAHVWLAADTVVFAVAGYGLLFAVVALLASGTSSAFAPTPWRAVLVATGFFGVVFAGVDVVENTIGHVVVLSGGDVAAGALGALRTLKWIAGAVVVVVFVVGWLAVLLRKAIRALTGSAI